MEGFLYSHKNAQRFTKTSKAKFFLGLLFRTFLWPNQSFTFPGGNLSGVPKAA